MVHKPYARCHALNSFIVGIPSALPTDEANPRTCALPATTQVTEGHHYQHGQNTSIDADNEREID